jgi:uncharacterized protein
MNSELAGAAPVGAGERISSIDVLRGFAVLGILIMNVQSFSMIEAAYVNPTAYGDLTGLNRLVWSLSHVLADSKFISIFSMLFGAGIVLMAGRLEARGVEPGAVNTRRNLWLMVLGLLHAYLLWYGDILFKYAVCGLIVFSGRKASARRLLIVGLVIFGVASLLSLLSGLTMSYWPEENRVESMRNWAPSAPEVDEEVAAYRGSWIQQMAFRIPAAFFLQTFLLIFRTGWQVCGLMLIGMAYFKLGILSAVRSRRLYLLMMAAGFGAGFPLVIVGMQKQFAAHWSFAYSMFMGSQYNYWGSLLVASGYVGMVMLVCKSGVLGGLRRRLAAVGRMALSNYLLETVICTAIFYGHGLGLYGRVERKHQILIVFAVWGLLIVVSPLWLRHFRFGPFEWLWRSLTYGRRQPMRN